MEVSTSLMGVLVKSSGTFGEPENTGWGASIRVIRDGPPHCGKKATTAGGGDLVTEEVNPPMKPVLEAIAAYCCDESRVLKTT